MRFLKSADRFRHACGLLLLTGCVPAVHAEPAADASQPAPAARPAAKRLSNLSALDLKDPPQGVFIDEWMLIEMMGQKSGYAHNEISRTGERIHMSVLMSMQLGRVGQTVGIAALQTSQHRLSGEPLAFTSTLNASAQTLESRGTIHDGKVTIVTDQFGVRSSSSFDYPVGAVMGWGLLLKQDEMGFKHGTRYTLQFYEPTVSAQAPLDVEIEVHAAEAIVVGGRQLIARRITQRMMNIDTMVWVDDVGSVLRSEMNLMGMPLVMQRCTKAEAMAAYEPPEFFMPTTIAVSERIDRNAPVAAFTLKLKRTDAPMPHLPDTGMQTVRERSEHAVSLRVVRMDHRHLRSAEPTVPGPALAEFLDANAIINSDDPAVQAMAETVRADATRPYAIADNLRRYVSEVVSAKNLNIGFATASEVCRNREGDCSEHAVLLAALGRACGLPSRVVIGVVYVPIFGGQENIFGFHMWTQFHMGGAWVDFDAAQNESDCNPTHIAFETSSLSDAGIGQLAFGLFNVIGNLELTVDKVAPVAAVP